jgi:hypothetical protein
MIYIQTRSGVVFSSWTTPANPTFDFKTLMDVAFAAEADELPIPDDGMASPLASPFSSLPSSPIPTPPRGLSPPPPSVTNLPTHIPTMSQAVPTNSVADDISKASFRKKKRSRKNQTKRRQAKVHEMGYTPPRESVKRALDKHVTPSNPVKTNLSIKKTDMASTGYVGLMEQKSKKDYILEELVGGNSKLGFRLIKWDGMYVTLHSWSPPGSRLNQNAHPHPGPTSPRHCRFSGSAKPQFMGQRQR